MNHQKMTQGGRLCDGAVTFSRVGPEDQSSVSKFLESVLLLSITHDSKHKAESITLTSYLIPIIIMIEFYH